MIEPTQSDRTSAASQQELDDLLEQVSQQLQAGKSVDIEALVREHPEHESRIRRLVSPDDLNLTNLGVDADIDVDVALWRIEQAAIDGDRPDRWRLIIV